MPNVPKPKPYTEEKFKQDADKFIKGYLGGFDKGEMNEFLKRSVDKIENAGVMSSDEAKDFIKERAFYLKEFAKENKGETLPQMKASGGRIGFLEGGTKYNAMVTKMYIEAGGQKGTGMDIDSFAKEYFPKFADGGRAQFGIGSLDPDAEFNERVRELMDDGYEFGQAVKKAMEETRKDQGDGTMPKSEKWMRDYFFSGKGGYDDRMSYKEFALGPGQELFKRFGND